MIIQGLNNIAAAYGSAFKSSVQRQTVASPAANYADRVSISDAAKALAESSQATQVQQRIDAIKAKPGVERTQADFEYLSANDKRFAELQDKIKANGNNGFDSLTADEVDYM